ncbi:2-oxoacid:acceptor oxidoreductase subunit alpha [Desulfospira joergensenii]|uniref:2-oxoacid:acceptor oxidoreductase subunit alpha n=1 Tax=Desulfospira joergensenii TaxID=53329 RepID=UPI0003B5FD59|nr:2-oxoacid:acceptor oxidoreductase subunit alpha [Desulfospira joergensenii]
MKDINIVIEICGSAGEGTISAGEILSRFMSGQGFEIMSFDSYPAEIRGFGKCVAHTRISSRPIYSPGKLADVLIALNDGHSISQLFALKPGGILIYDSQPLKPHEEDRSVLGQKAPGTTAYGIPLTQLAQKAAGNTRGRNMVALGAVAALFSMDRDGFTGAIQNRYAKKKQIVIDSNVNSFLEGFDWTLENIEKEDGYTFKEVVPEPGREKLIINGNQLTARAALDAGLKFYAGYPITPATKIMEILSRELPKVGGTLLQTEDEISAIAAVVGAGYGGVRSMTATSGPGFALMTEFTGLSVMAEVPAVIVNSQRGGPSTGIPTKTEQSDFEAAVMGGTGDCPRVVLAPTDTASCYDATVLGLYLAEKYQTLVVILLDFFLSNSIKNIDVPAKPPKEMLDANIAPDPGELKDYKRYRLTPEGISPRAIPGTPGGMFFATGLEHDERGRPNYSDKGHLAMTEKRYRKHQSLLREAPKPDILEFKEGRADMGVISWGSSAGAAREAVMAAQEQGIAAASFSSMILSPFPEEELKSFAAKCKKILVPELNYSGQFAGFASGVLQRPVERLNLITGRPMASEDILEKIREME